MPGNKFSFVIGYLFYCGLPTVDYLLISYKNPGYEYFIN